MPIPVVCASCQTKLVAPDAAAGKRVKCKICQAAIVVPTPVVEVEDDFAFGDPVKPVKAQPKPVQLDDDRPRKKSKVVVDDEDEIDPPRKRTKRKQVAKANPLKFVLLGLVGLMALGVVGAVAWYATSRGTTNGTSPSKDALDGWTRFEKRDTRPTSKIRSEFRMRRMASKRESKSIHSPPAQDRVPKTGC